MDQREAFVLEWIRGLVPKAELCAKYGVSRKTGYKWYERFLRGGLPALHDATRRPLRSPHKTPLDIEEAVLAARRAHPRWGPKKLQVLLLDAGIESPSPSTIGKILSEHGLSQSRRRKRSVHPHSYPLPEPVEPNDAWSADFKGQFRTRDGRYVYPLTVSDNVSRYLFACDGLLSTQDWTARETFERLFLEYGLPDRIRTDNGVPFASAAIAGLSRLSVWWLKLGIWPERTRKGCPQDNGRHERMHRTLKAETTRPPGANRDAQQELFDWFLEEYNELRPHEALGQKTPSSAYRPSSRLYTGTPEEFEYPGYFETRKISINGTLSWKGEHVFVSEVLRGERVGLLEIDDELWEVHVGPMIVAHFDARAFFVLPAPAAPAGGGSATSSPRKQTEES